MSCHGRYTLSCSTGTLALARPGAQYYDLRTALECARELGLSDLELLLHPEWRPEHPPRTPSTADWASVPKLDAHQVRALVLEAAREGLTFPSVHANRDIGKLLCSRDLSNRREALQELMRACLLATELGATVVVVHAWDTYAPILPLEDIAAALRQIMAELPPVPVLSLENIPTSERCRTPAQTLRALLEMLPAERVGVTVDLTWASLCDNLPDLLELTPRVNNVHIHAKIVRPRQPSPGFLLRPYHGHLDLMESIRQLAAAGYRGLWTLELRGARCGSDFTEALARLHHLLQDATSCASP